MNFGTFHTTLCRIGKSVSVGMHFINNAFCDDPRPNPEHFNLEAMMMMMGMGLPGGAPPDGDTKNTVARL